MVAILRTAKPIEITALYHALKLYADNGEGDDRDPFLPAVEDLLKQLKKAEKA
ncbi:MAG: hypothetical protein Q7R45_13000 [Sulfuricaulis sp.]|nr:hypothetical protein [Sulfuricaulis sp.]